MRLGDNLCHNDPSGQRAYKCSQQRESGLGNEIRQRVQILSSGGVGVRAKEIMIRENLHGQILNQIKHHRCLFREVNDRPINSSQETQETVMMGSRGGSHLLTAPSGYTAAKSSAKVEEISQKRIVHRNGFLG